MHIHNMKTKAMLILAAIAALIGLAVAVWRLAPSRPASAPSDAAPPATPAPADACGAIAAPTERQSCQTQGYARWLDATREQAFAGKSAAACGRIPVADDRDVCLLELVSVVPEAAVCERITAANRRQDCQNRLIIRHGSMTACRQIADAVDREYCFERAVNDAPGGGAALCPTLTGDDQNRCWEVYYTYQAVTRVDYEQCRKIPVPEGVARCRRKLPNDADGDGLSDFAERSVWQTDPQNADTDGDGYSDGVEVKGGYNPRGPGKTR